MNNNRQEKTKKKFFERITSFDLPTTYSELQPSENSFLTTQDKINRMKEVFDA
jgi:hypothetical protein